MVHLTRLEECYERGLLRKVAASKEKAMQSLAQAREWITEAGDDCDAGSLRSALMAAYMGYFSRDSYGVHNMIREVPPSMVSARKFVLAG